MFCTLVLFFFINCLHQFQVSIQFREEDCSSPKERKKRQRRKERQNKRIGGQDGVVEGTGWNGVQNGGIITFSYFWRRRSSAFCNQWSSVDIVIFKNFNKKWLKIAWVRLDLFGGRITWYCTWPQGWYLTHITAVVLCLHRWLASFLCQESIEKKYFPKCLKYLK